MERSLPSLLPTCRYRSPRWDHVCKSQCQKKRPWKERGEEVPECVVLLDSCPPFLKKQFINSILCVHLRRQVCGLSVPLCQRETERNFVIHRFCQGPWMALCVQRHFRFQWVGVGHLPGCKEFGYWLPSRAFVLRAVCDVPQRTAIQTIPLGPWQQRRKQTGCKVIKEIVLTRQSLGSDRISCRDLSGWVVYMAFWRDAQERPSDDFISRTFDFVLHHHYIILEQWFSDCNLFVEWRDDMSMFCGPCLLNKAGDKVFCRSQRRWSS